MVYLKSRQQQAILIWVVKMLDNILVNHFKNEFKRKHKKDINQKIKKLLDDSKQHVKEQKELYQVEQLPSIELDSLFDGIDF